MLFILFISMNLLSVISDIFELNIFVDMMNILHKLNKPGGLTWERKENNVKNTCIRLKTSRLSSINTQNLKQLT